MEDKVIQKEIYSETNLHPILPVATQETHICNEKLAKLDNSDANIENVIAKKSLDDGEVVQKHSLIKGEMACLAEELCPRFDTKDTTKQIQVANTDIHTDQILPVQQKQTLPEQISTINEDSGNIETMTVEKVYPEEKIATKISVERGSPTDLNDKEV